jgi:hypothetical protein|tara:strand:- start:349 stop:561 length:213 start_codon:yes stop_codon:yes gene_type:complete
MLDVLLLVAGTSHEDADIFSNAVNSEKDGQVKAKGVPLPPPQPARINKKRKPTGFKYKYFIESPKNKHRI